MKILKIILSIPLFFLLTYIYAFFVILLLMLPVFLFANDEFLSSGIWVVFLIIGLIIGAIFSLSTIIKTFFKNNNISSNKEEDKLMEEYNIVLKNK